MVSDSGYFWWRSKWFRPSSANYAAAKATVLHLLAFLATLIAAIPADERDAYSSPPTHDNLLLRCKRQLAVQRYDTKYFTINRCKDVLIDNVAILSE